MFRETGDEGTVRRAPISSEARVAGARRRPLRDGRGPGRAARRARRPRGLVGQAVDDDRGGLGGPRPRRRPAVRRARPDPDGQPAPRPRQARDPGGHPGPPGRPRDLRVAGRDRASRRSVRSCSSRRARCATRRRSCSTTTSGTTAAAIPTGSTGGRHPDRRPDRVDRGRVRGDDLGPAVPGGDLARGRARRAPPPGGRPVRPGSRRGVRRAVRGRPAVGPGRPRGGPRPRPRRGRRRGRCRAGGGGGRRSGREPSAGAGGPVLPGGSRRRTTAEIHDAVHDRRRRAG